ncbi:MAG: hypothetical protein KDM63_07770 [Verrucomicrobiae bacterium]|nr:hypothetical protein [Verrucomicrobiae bacterium]MCB1086928.1 hypothetical protein [Verrucomicrobiae bacterium]MCB1092081.1 hypothetical protein [Verrucomicrobiae bacterium]
MARPKNTLDTIQITISTTAQVRDVLERLTSSGLYGKNAADTAQALLKERIRELMEKGQVPD